MCDQCTFFCVREEFLSVGFCLPGSADAKHLPGVCRAWCIVYKNSLLWILWYVTSERKLLGISAVWCMRVGLVWSSPSGSGCLTFVKSPCSDCLQEDYRVVSDFVFNFFPFLPEYSYLSGLPRLYLLPVHQGWWLTACKHVDTTDGTIIQCQHILSLLAFVLLKSFLNIKRSFHPMWYSWKADLRDCFICEIKLL